MASKVLWEALRSTLRSRLRGAPRLTLRPRWRPQQSLMASKVLWEALRLTLRSCHLLPAGGSEIMTSPSPAPLAESDGFEGDVGGSEVNTSPLPASGSEVSTSSSPAPQLCQSANSRIEAPFSFLCLCQLHRLTLFPAMHGAS